MEIEPDNSYMVVIDGVYTGTITDNGVVDDSVLTFESALSTGIELMLTDTYEITQVRQYVSCTKGRLCRQYVVSIDE
jgi:hypothetical protein